MNRKNIIILQCVLAISAMLASVHSIAGSIEDAIDERLTPPGRVCIEGSDCPTAATVSATASVTATTVSATASGPARSGKEVYDTACMACHKTGAAGAPVVGNIQAWSARIAQGTDTLYKNAINGINVMPAKGGCMSCSDDEIQAAVDYMVENSQ